MIWGPKGISVIIPNLNREEELKECLAALWSQTLPPMEIIVVDDGSTDGSEEVAMSSGCVLVQAGGGRQANYCRNLGAARARGELLAFFDSDTVAAPDALEVAARSLEHEDVDAAVGLYAVRHRHPNPASQYKNLWIRYSYLRSAGHIDWIFGAVSVIRKEAFLRAGGFDGTMMMTHGGEDLELGKRMRTHDLRILLNPRCEVEHLKHHTLATLLLNDLRRSEGFVRVAGKVGHLGESVTSGFVNVYPAFAYSVPLSWVLPASGAGALLWDWGWLVFLPLLLLYAGLNGPFLAYVARHRGFIQALPVTGILFLDHLVCAGGVMRGLLKHLARR